LLGDSDLPLAVLTGKGRTDAELTRLRNAGHVPFGIAGADAVQRLGCYDVEIPRRRIHRRWRAHVPRDDLLDQFLPNRIRLVTADASATENNVVKLHFCSLKRQALDATRFWDRPRRRI